MTVGQKLWSCFRPGTRQKALLGRLIFLFLLLSTTLKSLRVELTSNNRSASGSRRPLFQQLDASDWQEIVEADLESPDPPSRKRVFAIQEERLLHRAQKSVAPEKHYEHLPLCPDLASYPGRWRSEDLLIPYVFKDETRNLSQVTMNYERKAFWQPFTCQYHPFTPREIQECFAHRSMIFTGDSLLRNVLSTIVQLVDPKFEWSVPKGQADQDINLDFGELGKAIIKFYWSNSVYFTVPHWTDNGGRNPGVSEFKWKNGSTVADIESLDPTTISQETYQIPKFDTVVMSIAPWDMGVYNLNLSTYHARLTTLFHEVFGALRFDTTPKEQPLPNFYFMTLPKLFTRKCEDDAPICRTCNTEIRQSWYREAQWGARQCLPVWFPDQAESFKALELFDTIDMTSGPEGYQLSDDGVHWKDDATRMQGTILLNRLCRNWLDQSPLYEEKMGEINRTVTRDDMCANFSPPPDEKIHGHCPPWFP
ncbi:hypothetical protein BZG36_04806 [Bifiguratus adelaidae]|uniref:Uncharacterized protein n=1 Tax=Bifiguratus adelaidae TaxID=1938954 RepID=A0A261XV19_9FUNG|nr:hypothetical protein BZG36_04806 [Bifiguratus adelaidae]